MYNNNVTLAEIGGHSWLMWSCGLVIRYYYLTLHYHIIIAYK